MNKCISILVIACSQITTNPYHNLHQINPDGALKPGFKNGRLLFTANMFGHFSTTHRKRDRQTLTARIQG